MITVGMKLTTDTNGLGMTGEMIVTEIEKANPDMPFYEGDIIRVKQRMFDEGDIIREYDTYFMANRLVDGTLIFNYWTWSAE